jgi:ribosomal protein S18 acetylase RimI-like enzyme
MRDESYEPDTETPAPELHFRAVTTKTIGDFASFRQAHHAFGSCSCMRWRMKSAEFERSTRSIRMRAFDALVEDGTPVGILAYRAGVVVGWCSIAPRETFAGIDARARIAGAGDTHIWSVTCLYVDPRHRRQSIALHLLRAAVEYARAEGAKTVEGYPAEPGRGTRMGSASMFRRAGFRDVTPPGKKRRVMRNVVA